MSTSYISMLESGKRYPSIEMLIRVAIALNASPGDMLNRIAERYAQHEQNRTDYPGDGASQGSLF